MSEKRAASVLMFVVLLVDLVLWGHSTGWVVGSPRRNAEYWRRPEVVTSLNSLMGSNPSSYRVLTASHSFDPNVAPVAPSVSHSPVWDIWTQPDVYMMHGIQNAAGYEGFGLSRYSELAGRMKVWGELMDPELSLRTGSREIDLLNVHYLLSMREQADSSANKTKPVPAFPPATVEYGNAKFAAEDLGLPNLETGKRLIFTVPEVESDRISLVTNLSFAENISDGVVVAHVRLITSDDRELDFQLRAGVNTAEWAHDRPDIRARIKHSRPTVATSYQVNDAVGSYEAHTYVATFSLEKMAIKSGEIFLEAVDKAPDLALSVYRISLANSSTSTTYPLQRNWLTIQRAGEASSTNLSAHERWKRVAQTRSVDIYQNQQALPRTWLVSETRVLDEPAMLDVIRKGKFADGSSWDPERTALIEGPLAEAVKSSEGEARITRYEPNRIELSASVKEPSLLVLSENHYPGWKSYVDGEAVETVRVDYNLRGVPLPAGSHQVEFLYRPTSVFIGLGLSLLAIALLTFWSWSRKKANLPGVR